MTFSTIVATVLLSVPGTAQDPDWLVVRGESELISPMSYEKLASVYLSRRETRIVRAKDAGEHRKSSRVVVGTPGDHALVEELARSMGLTFEHDTARFRGRYYGPGTGFVLVDADPDGHGLLALVTGVDRESLFNCFTVSLNIIEPGYSVIRKNTVLASGPLIMPANPGRPIVVRLDRDFDRLMAETVGWPQGDRELRVARGLAGFGHVFHALGSVSADTLPSTKVTLTDPRGAVTLARNAFAKRDLSEEILAIYERCRVALDVRDAVAPVIYVALDGSSRTNGRSFGIDPVNGRPQVVLNLAELGPAGNFDTVCMHECLHTFQWFPGRRAVDRGMREGTATLGTQIIDPSVSDAEALLWSDAELAAAERHRDELIAEFKKVAASTDEQLMNAWFRLDGKLTDIPDAPSRSGYYVCWLACQAWREAHPSSTLGELFFATSDELLAALD